MKKLLFFILIITLFSCVKQVSLDDQHEERLVVEGLIEIGELAQLQLFKTASVTDSIDYPTVNSANVILENNFDEIEVLQSLGNGLYESTNIIGEENTAYSLTIEFDEETYRTTTKIPENLLIIDTVLYNISELVANEYFLSIDVEMNKLVNENVFETIKFYQNDQFIRNDKIFLIGENQFSGTVNFLFPDNNWKIGDVLKIELLQMEKWLHDYFLALENNDVSNSVNGLLVSPPGEIYNNFDGDILGFFGAIRKQTIEVVIE